MFPNCQPKSKCQYAHLFARDSSVSTMTLAEDGVNTSFQAFLRPIACSLTVVYTYDTPSGRADKCEDCASMQNTYIYKNPIGLSSTVADPADDTVIEMDYPIIYSISIPIYDYSPTFLYEETKCNEGYTISDLSVVKYSNMIPDGVIIYYPRDSKVEKSVDSITLVPLDEQGIVNNFKIFGDFSLSVGQDVYFNGAGNPLPVIEVGSGYVIVDYPYFSDDVDTSSISNYVDAVNDLSTIVYYTDMKAAISNQGYGYDLGSISAGTLIDGLAISLDVALNQIVSSAGPIRFSGASPNPCVRTCTITNVTITSNTQNDTSYDATGFGKESIWCNSGGSYGGSYIGDDIQAPFAPYSEYRFISNYSVEIDGVVDGGDCTACSGVNRTLLFSGQDTHKLTYNDVEGSVVGQCNPFGYHDWDGGLCVYSDNCVESGIRHFRAGYTVDESDIVTNMYISVGKAPTTNEEARAIFDQDDLLTLCSNSPVTKPFTQILSIEDGAKCDFSGATATITPQNTLYGWDFNQSSDYCCDEFHNGRFDDDIVDGFPETVTVILTFVGPNTITIEDFNGNLLEPWVTYVADIEGTYILNKTATNGYTYSDDVLSIVIAGTSCQYGDETPITEFDDWYISISYDDGVIAFPYTGGDTFTNGPVSSIQLYEYYDLYYPDGMVYNSFPNTLLCISGDLFCREGLLFNIDITP